MNDDMELKERLSKLSDQELVEMVTVGANDYRQEALDYAKAELKYRRVDWAPLKPTKTEDGAAPAIEPTEGVDNASAPACIACGGSLRLGTLVAEKELTVIFTDNREERFIRVLACKQCGQVSLYADYETEVE